MQTLERGLQVIQAFSEEHQALTVSEVSKLTGLSRPTARRILLTLEHLGFAESQNNAFTLTARILSLGYAYLSSNNKWSIAHPFMRDFVNQTGESCSISILDDTNIIYVARLSTKRIMSINLDVGSRLPAFATSMGHVLLAHLSPETLENYFNKMNFEQYTDQTITNKEEFMKILEEVRMKNWSGVDQQFEEGLRSIAVPLRDGNNRVFAAMNCSTHAGRISKETLHEEFLPLLQETAAKISKAMIVTNDHNFI